ncbi:putative antirepressor protein [Acinetobacter phage BUCT629]|uniref:Superinfection immunity protein n=2 Tax=Obolenskvirus TaxID=1915205 RepID=A0A1X9SFL9_9CAUD|nr:anti-repressor Ant [Acinetobacter phage WCHABP12]YP_009604563.1 anti-repressor Ant [Acinetobacter phage WCHABP1]QEA11072.1 antirepressor protein KilAC domain protein [Acinetobacter phage Abp9]QZI85385.1 putative antirepressor protein [Acinetobacter phage BUCT629]WPH63951.1 anti-repressor [Acinetobacter phage HZY2308]ARB06778.1 putative antirepressor protein [Acinetobacter phage WCHABP12]ARQ94793.1 putative superinfection immunity protein [Acinetobacter phage WCHABP1]
MENLQVLNTTSKQIPQMSSLEIVDFINEYRAKNDDQPIQLRHADFMAKVQKVLGELSENYRSVYKDASGRSLPCYVFYKREACLMAMSYSYELQALVFDRMTELENKLSKPQLPDFTNPVEAARAWADEVEAKLIAQKQLELAAPKVEYFDRVADVGNLMTASVVGKKIGMSAQVLNAHLQEMKVYDKRQKGRVFQQWFIDKGYGELKKTDNGYNQSKFTNKGEQWIIEKFVSEGIV